MTVIVGDDLTGAATVLAAAKTIDYGRRPHGRRMFIPSAVLFPQCQRGSQGCAGAMLTAIFSHAAERSGLKADSARGNSS
jgi:hypothetical protein